MVDTKSKKVTEAEQKKRDEELKTYLSPKDYKLLTAARASQERIDKASLARTMANQMCTQEDGKYFDQFSKHDKAANAVYDKAKEEATKIIGDKDMTEPITDAEKKVLSKTHLEILTSGVASAARRDKNKAIIDKANELVDPEKGGKYADEYVKHDTAAREIADQALSETRTELGLTDKEKP